eukprot:TRINITY_DN1862_c0_g1_i1.p2 TRINITY_DN1862_c0_g1~~TRINITY_DN1862_c0_g1_i1.p2  ORF type:complete len:213 (-),score=24.72 TRINITY_DN1862_c0_g1_i1:18-656(-)
MGKTTFKLILEDQLKAIDRNLYSIQADEIRRKLMDFYQSTQRFKLSDEELFDKTKFQMNKEWENEIKKLLQQRIDKDDQQEVFVFIDKNHPPNGIDKSIKQIKELIPLNFTPVIVAIIPQCMTQFKLESDKVYPFSLTFIMNCIHRVQTRKLHPTLPGSGIRSLGIMSMFINTVSYTHLRAHETRHDLVCRLLLEKKKNITHTQQRITDQQS